MGIFSEEGIIILPIRTDKNIYWNFSHILTLLSCRNFEKLVLFCPIWEIKSSELATHLNEAVKELFVFERCKKSKVDSML